MTSGRMSQRKGAAGERELTDHLRRAGYPVSWGGNRTYGTVPDVFGLPGIHIECKRVEQLNIAKAVEQAARDAERFQDGSPAVFHRKNKAPWLVTMRLTDWLSLSPLLSSTRARQTTGWETWPSNPHSKLAGAGMI